MKIKNLLVICSFFLGLQIFAMHTNVKHPNKLRYMQLSPSNIGILGVDINTPCNIPEEFKFCTAVRCYDLRAFANNPVTMPFFTGPRYFNGVAAAASNNGVFPSYCYVNTTVRTYNICTYSPAFLSSEYTPVY